LFCKAMRFLDMRHSVVAARHVADAGNRTRRGTKTAGRGRIGL
jgi:hypothetical protein